MRSADRSRFQFKPVLIATVLVLGGVTAFFTFVAPKHLARKFPLGIAQEEVTMYARWFDRDRQAPTTALPVYILPDGPIPMGSTEVELRSGDRTGMVRWKRTVERAGSFTLHTDQTRLLGTDAHVWLVPATTDDIRAKYLQLLAGELGLLTPEVSFVHVQRNGRTRLYRRTAVTGAAWMARHGIMDAVPFRKGFDPSRPDHLMPVVEADEARGVMLAERLAGFCAQSTPAPPAVLREHVDAASVAAWFLLLQLEGDPAPLKRTQQFYYRETTGRIFPVFAPAVGSNAIPGGPQACDPFTPLLNDPEFVQQIQAHREHLLDVRGQLRERFAALDDDLLPQLAGDGSVRSAQARARAMADTLLEHRLGAPLMQMTMAGGGVPMAGWASWRGHTDAMAHVETMATTTGPTLAEVRRKYWIEMRGDTIVFRRAKYRVQEDLILPPGHPVLFLSGARLELGAGHSLVCQGPVEVRATALNPVFVRAAGAAPFGTFAVHAQGGPVRMEGLRMSGGAGATVDGVAYDAMLAIHGSNEVTMRNCELDMGHVGSVMEIDGGRLRMEGGRCTGGRVALKQVQGRMHGTELSIRARQRGLMGLQVTGGRFVLDSVQCSGFPDAALFAADGAQLLVYGAHFTRNGVAIRAGDLAMVHAAETHFAENATVFQVPTAQEGAGAGRFHLYNNTMAANGREQDLAGDASAQRHGRLDAAVRMAFGLK